nr:peptidyl-prolyl cis-trans isomerase H-like [Kogia breviceps]
MAYKKVCLDLNNISQSCRPACRGTGWKASVGYGGGSGRDQEEAGCMKIELFADIVPKTAENFRKDGVPIGYKGSTFHGVIKDFMIQGGDFVNGDGTGVASIYWGPFADENCKLRHSAPGLLSMANSGPSTNGCQFFITCSKCDWLDGKHVGFGKITDGLLVMRKIENVPTGPNNKPTLPVVISQRGEM